MNFRFTAAMTAAILCAASAVSCGKDASSSSDVVLEINTTKSTEETTEETTESSSVTTTDKKSAVTTATTTKGKTTTTTSKSDKPETVTTAAATEAPQDTPADPEPEPEQPVDDTPQPEPQTEAPTEAPKPKKDTFSASDIDRPMSDMTAVFGDMSPTHADACIPKGDEGDSVYVYDYGNIEFQCYSQGGVHYVGYIIIRSADYSTDKGIRIGSSRADISGAYSESFSDGNNVVVPSGGAEYYFVMNGDTVSEIQINVTY